MSSMSLLTERVTSKPPDVHRFQGRKGKKGKGKGKKGRNKKAKAEAAYS